jgi:hypothetical protein
VASKRWRRRLVSRTEAWITRWLLALLRRERLARMFEQGPLARPRRPRVSKRLTSAALSPIASRLRVGLVYLGGASAAFEPAWRTLPDEGEIRARLAAMGDRLVRARWSGSFPRVALDRCEAITCGFIGRCHASAAGGASAPPATDAEGNGTDANPPRATT